jgi:hypothetical protein
MPSVSLIAGVGVLLLAMGVGVLIGRAGAPTAATAPPEVVSVSTGAPATGSTATSGAVSPSTSTEFSDSWPAARSGYTVQLQTLASAGTQASEVSAAEAAATAKGASGVGAVRSDDYRGLPSGLYIIYAGVYASAAQAKHGLAGLSKRFPAAKVIHVVSGTGTGKAAGAKTGQGSTGKAAAGTSTGSSTSPPPSSASGQSNEQKSRNEPDVVSTG